MKLPLRLLAPMAVVWVALACVAGPQPWSLEDAAQAERRTPEIIATGLYPVPPELLETGPQLATQFAATLGAQSEAGPAQVLATQVVHPTETAHSATPAAALATTDAPSPSPVPPAATATPSPPSPLPTAAVPRGTTGARVANALSTLLGDQPGTAMLPSYHLEIRQLWPVLRGDLIVQREERITADVAGKDSYFMLTLISEPGNPALVSEGYLIDGTAYHVSNGQVAAEAGPTAVLWSTWPVNVLEVLELGALQAIPVRVDMYEGREAEQFTLGSLPPSAFAVPADRLPISDITGQVWVDRATGALLKARLDYRALPLADASSTPVRGPGRLEVTVSQIGLVVVWNPAR